MKYLKTDSFCKVVIALLLLAVTTIPTQAAQRRDSSTGLQITDIIFGEDTILTGKTQLIEVVLKNTSRRNIVVKVKLVITLPNRNVITFGDKSVLVKDKTYSRVLFDYPVKRYARGDYTVGVKVYAAKSGRVLASISRRQHHYFLAVNSLRNKRSTKVIKKKKRVSGKVKYVKKTGSPKVVGKITEKPEAQPEPEQVVLFDPPDLLWERVEIINQTSILRGETAHVRMILANQGGDVAMGVSYSIKWYLSQHPKRKKRVYWNQIKVIAPGEKKVLELPITIPTNELVGSYMIQAVVDEPNYIKETNENNNNKVASKPIIFSDIAQVFPDDEHSFAEDGLFRFQWRSQRFSQFKLQVSADNIFRTGDKMFNMPKGDRWQSATTIKPKKGEMPVLALALMSSNEVDKLYWRVKAKNSAGRISYSTIRVFFINLKAE